MQGISAPGIDTVAELSISARADEVRRASIWLVAACLERQVPARESGRLDACLNEVLANIIAHGGPTALSHPICLRLEVRHDQGSGEATVTVSDAGTAFDPLAVAPQPAPQALAEAEPGGLGLMMIRGFADTLAYRHGEGRNRLSLGVRWTESSADREPPRRTVFRRGPERRKPEHAPAGRQRGADQRKLGIGWIPLFRGADESAVGDVLADCEVLRFSSGTALLRPGQTNQNVYILLSGQATAHLDANLGQDTAIPIAAGECMGELSAIDGKPVSALVLALTDVRVLKLSREVFWYRLMVLPGVAGNLMITLAERMRRTNEVTLKVQRQQLELSHLRKELDVARQLQAGMLPLQRPMFPERDDIEVCSLMEPASIIGGDLFDGFFVDDRQLFFCIGDVSGHGIVAALFMARTIGLLRILAMNTLRPDKLLEILNERLCVGNDANIFVTLFCGFLDVESGKLRYSNGGHCAPMLAAGGKARPLAIPKGALIGAFPGLAYTSMEQQLAPGDILFCYTDGVTEAQNAMGDEFSESRCLDVLGRAGSLALSAVLDTVRGEVARFSGSGLLADDCTMLAVRRPSLAPGGAASTTPQAPRAAPPHRG